MKISNKYLLFAVVVLLMATLSLALKETSCPASYQGIEFTIESPNHCIYQNDVTTEYIRK